MKWIKCSDRLPDTEQEVIVYFKNLSGWQKTSAYWDGNDFIESCEICTPHKKWVYPITHWMPLPESPNEENTEQP